MMMYTIAQVNSTESLTPELLFPFPWDEEREPIEIDENELKELRERAKIWNMASNAIVRLLFNTADFDKNIRRAKGEIGNFEKA